MSPKVSVIIPVYNVEDYLPACLDSVLTGTLANLEVICVDDCSPDRCPQILDEYAAEDDRIKVVRLSENGGPGNARNIGFARACGDYVYFLDADDKIAPEALERLVARADADSLDVLWFDSEPIYETEDLAETYADYPGSRQGTYPEGVVAGVEMLDLFVSQEEWLVYVQGQLIRRQFLIDEGISFPLFKTHQDEVFSFEVAVAAKRSAYVRELYFLRRWRPDSLSTDEKTAYDFRCYLEALGLVAKFVRERECSHRGAYKQIANMYWLANNNRRFLVESDEAIEEVLPTPELLFGYDIFAASLQVATVPVENMRPEVMEKAVVAKRVFLYGAGRVAGKALPLLDKQEIPVSGIIVSDASKNPKTLWCHPVLALDSVIPQEGDLVIIAVTETSVPAIANDLTQRGWNFVSWREYPPAEKSCQKS